MSTNNVLDLPVDELIQSQTQPPPFGHSLLKYFMFDPQYTNLNNGAYGCLPLPVYHTCTSLTRQIESSPDYFVRVHQNDAVKASREALAPLVGTDPKSLVLVHNASTGIYTILNNIVWNAEDTLVVANTTYSGVERNCTFIADSFPYPKLERLTITFPCSNSKILEMYKECFERLAKEKKEKGTGKVVAVLDTIIFMPGVYVPWKAVVQLAKEYGVMTVVDGAHSVGQEPKLELDKSGVDFFVSNGHKWLYVKRGCAFLYVPERNQHLIRSTFPPSHAYLSPEERAKDLEGFHSQFKWDEQQNGTFDIVSYLSIVPALKFRQWLGGEEAIFYYCHRLAIQGGKRITELLGTQMLDTSDNYEQTLTIVSVGIPLPDTLPMTTTVDNLFKLKTLEERRIFAPICKHGGKWWCRISVQVWVEMADFEEWAKVLRKVCKEIVDEVDQFGEKRG